MSTEFLVISAHSEAGPSRPRPSYMHNHSNDMANTYHQPPASQAEDYDDLLIGLGSDDMNDFDGLDEVKDLSSPSRAGGSKGGRGTDVFDDFNLDPDPFDSSSIPKLEGFKTGKGTKIAPPSSEALECARKRFELDESDLIYEPDADVQRDHKRPRITEDESEDPALEDIPAPEFVMLESVGFVNGRGQAVAPPSESALQKALQILSAVDDEPDIMVSQATPTAAPRQVSAFTTGNGNAVAGPSRLAMTSVSRLFDDLDQPQQNDVDHTAIGGLSTPAKSIPRPQGDLDDARRKAMAIFGEEDICTPTTSRGSMLPPVTSTPFRPLVAPTPTSRPLNAAPVAPLTPSTTFRTPLRPTTNTFTQPYSSSVPRSVIKQPAAIQIKTPTSTRRINVGLTPARNRTKKTFVTPFKGGSKLAGSPLNKVINTPRTSFVPISKVLSEPKKVVVSSPVFDLTIPDGRKNAKDAYLHPQYTTHEELREMGLPDEIWRIDLQNALQYRFVAEDATLLDHTHAFKILQKDECHLVSSKWVSNHWSMILWKLAGQVQAKPSLFDQKWNWGEVVAQLKYRYEREFGQAQRPIIRRIQEHDSSPSLPMILCVAGVHWTHQPTEAGEEPAPPRPYLELTDGWYKIVAEVDECMTRAVKRGVICTGRKLAISGAKLDSGSEGAEVPEAFDKSRLIISGNSTSLARWHARMGLQPEPFIAGLSSLSVDGGQIMLMDIIIDKLFPVAYINGQKGSREGPWNEDEERARSDLWKEKYQAESTSLREKMSKRLEVIEDLVETLVSAAQDVEDPVNSNPPDNLEREFDEMLNARDSSARIRQLTGGHLIHLARYARSRMEQEIAEGQAEIEGELQSACPIREVRDFRMARVSDARDGYKETARFAMLNIWDVKSLGHDTIREGGRYLVSNLMPGRQGDWAVPRIGGEVKEIYLHTRRDTRWKEVNGCGSEVPRG